VKRDPGVLQKRYDEVELLPRRLSGSLVTNPGLKQGTPLEPGPFRGRCGWLTLPELEDRLSPAVVAAAARNLEPGGFSEPLEAPQGFCLVRLLGRREAEVRPFAEVEPILRHRVREEKRQATEAQLRAETRRGLTIRTNLTLLNSLALTNRPAAPPPAMPGT